MKRVLISSVFLLSACATPYEKGAILSGGVKSFWQAPNVLVVNAGGNAYTTKSRVNDFLFLQAAEKALEVGYTHFVVLGTEDTSTTRTFTTNNPTKTQYSGNVSPTYSGARFNGTATTTGGPVVNTYAFPGASGVFGMTAGVPVGYREGQYFVAAEVYNALGQKYIKDFEVGDLPSAE